MPAGRSCRALLLLAAVAGFWPALPLAAAAADAAPPVVLQLVVLPTPIRAAFPAPYGIDRGTCDREPLARAAAGATAGDAPGSVSADGTVMAPADQLCVAQALEYAPDQRTVRWVGAQGQEWIVAPQETFERDGVYCRTFEARGQVADRPSQFINTACRGADGLWHAAG